MSVKRAKQVAEDANGSFGANDLTQKNTTSTPLVEYLGDDEQLHYLLTHSSKGFRIFETNGKERTPDHGSPTWGSRYLLISDQRILYVVGDKSEDKVTEFSYQNINQTDANSSITHSRLNFTLANGREYKFATRKVNVEEAEEYIEQCIYRRYEKLTNQVAEMPNVDIEVPEPASFDKLWERKNQYDTIEDDISIWETAVTRQKQLQQRATALSILEINVPDVTEFDSPQVLRDAFENTEVAIEKCEQVAQEIEFIENLSESATESKINEAQEVADKCQTKLTSLARDYYRIIDTSPIEDLQQSVEHRLDHLQKEGQISRLKNTVDEAKQALAQHEVDTAKQQISDAKTRLRESSNISADKRTDIDEKIACVESNIADLQDLQETEQIARAKLDEAQIKIEEGEYDAARSIAQYGIGACQEVIDSEFSIGSDIVDSIEEIQSELRGVQSEAEDISKLIKRAEQQRESASVAVDSDAYETAKESVNELEQSVTELEEYDSTEAEMFRNDIEVITREIERAQATTRVNDLLTNVDSKIAHGESLLSEASFDKANQSFRTARKSLKEVSRIVQANELHRPEEIEQKGADLEEIIQLATRTASLLAKVEERINSGSYESANSALSELSETVERVSANNLVEEPLDRIHRRVDKLQTEIDDQLMDKRWDELLTKVDSLSDTAEDLIDQSDYIEAEEHLISALETVDEAATVGDQASLGNQEIVFEKQGYIQSLLTEVESQAKQQHSTLVTEAEELVGQGIESRKIDDPAGATEAFTKAEEQYAEALRLADKQNMPEQWETQERHAMVSEYLEITTEELEHRQRETQQEMATTLDSAESAISQAEQYAEVDDTVSVRDSLGDVVHHLDTATQLLNVAGVTEELRSRYNSLLRRADTLRKGLPDKEDKKSYRNQDLVESLQVLTTKLGEPPRQEFVNKYGEYPSEAYLNEFGSWSEALAAANLQQIDESNRGQRTYGRVELLGELTRVAGEIDEPPTRTQVNEFGRVASTTIENRFQDWETALGLAGITESEGNSKSQTTEESNQQQAKQRQSEETEQADILSMIQREINQVE